MRVLCVGVRYPPHHTGGYELHCQSVVRHLRSRGHEVAVLTSTLRVDGAVADDEPGVRRTLRAFGARDAWPGWRAAAAGERHNVAQLRGTLARFAPDIVCWWRMGELSLSLVEHVRRAGLPAVGVVCDPWLLEGPARDPWQRPWHRPAEPGARQGLRGRRRAALLGGLTGMPVAVDWSQAALWLFVSAWLRDRTLADAPDLARTAVAHAGVQLGLLDDRGAPPAWRGRLLYAGRLAEAKGADDAVAALAGLPRETTLTLHGHGSPADRSRLEATARQHGVSERVRFGGALDAGQMAAVYAAYDALVFPSRWEEPWGLVPLEAMAVGLPVVATGTGGSAEYLAPGVNALRFAPGDLEGLAASVRTLAGDPELRGRLAAAGRRTAERFGAESCDERVLAHLEAAVAPH